MTQVVLIEDDVLLGRQFVRHLTQAGYGVRHAIHAGEALTMIDDVPPDVIMLDMLLPATSGMALLHELQSYSDTAAIPIIVCTSMADMLSFEELRPYGVRRLLDKTTMYPADMVGAIRAITL